MHTVKFINYTNLPKDKLLLILHWRNSDFVRPWMIQQHIISEEEHLNFCTNLKQCSLKKFYLVECDGQPCGAINVHFEDSTYKVISDVGYYSFGKQKLSISTLAKYFAWYLSLKHNSQKVFIQMKNNNQRQTEILSHLYPYAKYKKMVDITRIEVDTSNKEKIKEDLKQMEDKLQATISFDDI